MVARSAPAIPEGPWWRYDPKLDGFRAVGLRRPDGRVQLQSRRQRSLTAMFPDVVEAVAAAVPAGTVLDGELVVMTGGQLDFLALQRRLTSRRVEAPATLVAFDVLAVGDEDVRVLPHAQRRARLEQLIEVSRTGLAVVPTTDNPAGARAWMRQDTVGVEGVVAKRADHSYIPHLHHWLKIRAVTTQEAIVGGILGSPQAPTSLILGRHDRRGRLRVIGRTLPLRPDASAELAELLLEPTEAHPWPVVLPGGRLGLPGAEPVAHTPVAPTVVVEIEADRAYEAGRYRHPARLIRIRAELRPADLSPW
jgi:ATP-dependent DNA ligase